MALPLETAGEAGERAVRAHDAMTRDDDGDRVASDGGTDRAGRPCLADPLRQLAVGGRLADGDPSQLLPDAQLERRALRVERQVEAVRRPPK